MTLAERLLAEYAAEEKAALAAQPPGTVWYTYYRQVLSRKLVQGVSEDHPDFDKDCDVFDAATKAHARHIVLHDPERVLRDIAAKRAIVELHTSCDDWSYGDASQCPELRALASVYAGREGWEG